MLDWFKRQYENFKKKLYTVPVSKTTASITGGGGMMKIDPKTGLPTSGSFTHPNPKPSSAISPLTIQKSGGKLGAIPKFTPTPISLPSTQQKLKDMGLLEKYQTMQAKQGMSPLTMQEQGGQISPTATPTPARIPTPTSATLTPTSTSSPLSIMKQGGKLSPTPRPEQKPFMTLPSPTPTPTEAPTPTPSPLSIQEMAGKLSPKGMGETDAQGFPITLPESSEFPKGTSAEQIRDFMEQPPYEGAVKRTFIDDNGQIKTEWARPNEPTEETTGEMPTEPTPIEQMAGALQPGDVGTTEPGRIDVQQQTLGVSEPTKIASIKKEIGEIESQLSTLQWQLDLIPGIDATQKSAFENMATDWAKAGMKPEMIAELVDMLTRADADKISNQIMPTLNKHLSQSPEIMKAKTTLEELYSKYTAKEAELNSKADEMNNAVMAIQQSPYLTQSMIVGRQDRMRDEYNMELSRIQNELNTMGKDIDRGRDALKTLTTEGWKLAEADIGALKMGVQEDVMGRMPFGYQSILRQLKGRPTGLYGVPQTIGAGQFGYDKKKGFEQVTPFKPATPTSKGEKQSITEEHDYALKGLAGEGGFVTLEQFQAMMEDWMKRSGDYRPQSYINMFSRKYLSPDDRGNLSMSMSGLLQ